jgi:hypothetical protein
MRLTATIPMLALCAATSCVLRTPTLTARTSSFPSGASSGPPPAPPSSTDAGGAVDGSQLIEAGCTFSGNDIKGEPGSVYQVACPPGCDKAAVLYGTDTYTSDSPVCAAAMHAGAISDRGGEATLKLEPGRPAYRGSKRNGVSTRDWGSYRASYRFVGVPSAPPPPPVAKAPILIEAGCTFSANDIHGEPGTVYRVSCPAGCNVAPPRIFGSDPYAALSPICVAAIHAGLASDGGGEFTLVLLEGRPAYRGSKRNGIASGDWSAYRASFHLER